MSKVTTRTITGLRDDIYAASDRPGVTAVTRDGKFVGVFITAGYANDIMADLLHRMIRNNPQHAVGLLTKRALG